MDTFGSNLVQLRKEKRVTQAQLANGIGVSIKTIRRYEHEESLPDAEMIRLIAKYLNVSADRLLRERPMSSEEYAAARSRVVRMVLGNLIETEPGKFEFWEPDNK